MTALRSVFDWKVRGIRVVEILGVAVLIAVVFSTYVAKAGAANQSARITELENRIAAEHQRVRLLRTEAARLEQPARLEALSRAVGLEPVAVTRRTTEEALPGLAPQPEAATSVEPVTEPAAAAAAPAEPEPEAEAVQ